MRVKIPQLFIGYEYIQLHIDKYYKCLYVFKESSSSSLDEGFSSGGQLHERIKDINISEAEDKNQQGSKMDVDEMENIVRKKLYIPRLDRSPHPHLMDSRLEVIISSIYGQIKNVYLLLLLPDSFLL